MDYFDQFAVYIFMDQQQTNLSGKGNLFRYLAHTLFFSFSLLYIIGPTLEISWFAYFKVFPLVIMMLLLLFFSKQKKGSTRIMVLGLIFGTIGDLVLQHGGQDLFAAGAGVFLFNHIMYNIYFLSLWENIDGSVLFIQRFLVFIVSIVFIALSSINLLTSFSDKTKDQNGILVYLLPLYMVILNFTALNPIILALSQRKLQIGTVFMVIGGICYYISDNLLGKTKFSDFAIFGERRINSIFIMTTYYLAQFFIPLSLLQKTDQPKRNSHEGSLLSESHGQ